MHKRFWNGSSECPFGNHPKSKIQNLTFGIVIVAVMVLALFQSAHAQPSSKLRRIGYLSVRSNPSEREAAFKHGLGELGWVEGENITIEYRWAKGKPELLPQLAAELVGLKVDVIVAAATAAVHAAKNTTSTIPIVMSPAADPVASKLVASLDRPGGNLTGLSLMGPELAGKRLELLREVLPRLGQVGFLAPGTDPTAALFVKEAQAAAQKLGLELHPFVIGGPEEIDGSVSKIKKQRLGALIVHAIFTSFPDQNRRIIELAARDRVPTISDLRDFPEAGGLMSYGPKILALYQRAGYFVDKILKGAKPTELPVEQPRFFETVMNLKTAKQIGVTIAPEILARADKVIK
jgi:putative tryptophan/tyrosine transport system substrate-binding protein